MRYVLIFVVIVCAVMVFIFSYHFPGFLSHYPRLQEANWTVREWLGMYTPRSGSLSEKHMEETDQILRKESSTNREVTEDDLGEYYE